MKYFFITFLAISFSMNLYSNEPDSLNITVIKDDSIHYRVYVNIENTSNDTIMLITKFNNDLINKPIGSGFRFSFYNGVSSFLPSMGDNYTLQYIYYGGRKYIYPNETIKLPIDLTEYFFRNKDADTVDSIEIEIAYKYIIISSNPQKRRVKNYYLKTDRKRVN